MDTWNDLQETNRRWILKSNQHCNLEEDLSNNMHLDTNFDCAAASIDQINVKKQEKCTFS